MFSRSPIPSRAVQTDNGAEFQSRLHWHVLDSGIRHIDIKPATPRLNGKGAIPPDRPRSFAQL